jgi:hypothetical protein
VIAMRVLCDRDEVFCPIAMPRVADV